MNKVFRTARILNTISLFYSNLPMLLYIIICLISIPEILSGSEGGGWWLFILMLFGLAMLVPAISLGLSLITYIISTVFSKSKAYIASSICSIINLAIMTGSTGLTLMWVLSELSNTELELEFYVIYCATVAALNALIFLLYVISIITKENTNRMRYK